MEPSGPKETPAQSHGVCSALRDSGVSDRGLGEGGGGGGAGRRKFPLRGPAPRHPQPAWGQVKRDRALLQWRGRDGGGGRPGNNGTFIWDCWVQRGWAEEGEDADWATGEGTGCSIWLHTCSCLTLCVPSAGLAGAG